MWLGDVWKWVGTYRRFSDYSSLSKLPNHHGRIKLLFFRISIHILEQNWHVMYKLRHSSHKKSKFPAQLPSAGFYNSVKPNVYNFNIKKKQSISDSIPNESFSGFCENARNENYMEILSFPDTTTNSIFSSYFNANKVVEIAPLNGGFRVLSNS